MCGHRTIFKVDIWNMPLIERPLYEKAILKGFRNHDAVALLGPRQCGKTTLAQKFRKTKKKGSKVHYFDMEDPFDLAKMENPMLTLEELSGLIIIDEIQRKPDLFPILRVLIDKHKGKQKYLILGSASSELIKQSSETLAGRIKYIELTPFTCSEVPNIKKLWLRGGFPKSYLARTNEDSVDWRQAYISTFLEKDIPQLGINIGSETLRRFWTMLAAYHGNIFNASEIGRSLGASHTTVQHYLDILAGTFMIRQLKPWHANINKRQVKSPKIYFRDSGILHTLLRIETESSLKNDPKLGAFWEGFALEQIISKHQPYSADCYFWSTHSGAELDLLIFKGEKRLGYEFKFTDQPTLTKSMLIAQKDLMLDSLTVVHPRTGNFPLDRSIRAIGLQELLEGL